MNVSLEEFVLGLVIISFLFLPLIAFLGKFLDWLAYRKTNKKKIVCRLCAMRFYAQNNEKIVICPNCDAKNER